MENTLTSNGLKPSVEKALFEGLEAGRKRLPIDANPYTEGALFDPDQLSAVWLSGRKQALDKRYASRRQRAWNRA